jgi:hypothetical protein
MLKMFSTLVCIGLVFYQLNVRRMLVTCKQLTVQLFPLATVVFICRHITELGLRITGVGLPAWIDLIANPMADGRKSIYATTRCTISVNLAAAASLLISECIKRAASTSYT